MRNIKGTRPGKELPLSPPPTPPPLTQGAIALSKIAQILAELEEDELRARVLTAAGTYFAAQGKP